MEKALQLVTYSIWRSEHGPQSLVMETNQPFLKEGRLRELENDSSSEMDSIDAPAVERISCRPQESLRHRLQRLVRLPTLMHLVLVLAYTSVYLYLTKHSLSQRCDERDLIYCPYTCSTPSYIEIDLPQHLHGALWSMKKKVFSSDLFNNSFTGQPRPELDDAWHRLLQSICPFLFEAELLIRADDLLIWRHSYQSSQGRYRSNQPVLACSCRRLRKCCLSRSLPQFALFSQPKTISLSLFAAS